MADLAVRFVAVIAIALLVYHARETCSSCGLIGSGSRTSAPQRLLQLPSLPRCRTKVQLMCTIALGPHRRNQQLQEAASDIDKGVWLSLAALMPAWPGTEALPKSAISIRKF